jgi:adenine-specific DNA methylase
MINYRRLIEEFLRENSIGEAASSESRTKDHISTLHVWRARRSMEACRAGLYDALLQALKFVLETRSAINCNSNQYPSNCLLNYYLITNI